jgi:hypothetical protein
LSKDKLTKLDPERQEFRKANEIIAPRVARGGVLTLLSRKVFNVLLYHTQRLGSPGQNAPDGDPLFAEFFWLPLQELAADSAYNSEDATVIKDALQRLQDIKIVADDAKGFASDVLIPNIRVIPDRRGKPTMVGWKLDSTTERILKTPELYTRLSIYYLTSLKSTASIALYEIAKRYSTNPSGLTSKESWEWWHDVLTGLPMTHEKPEFKYFKRDTVKPAIAEVNTTDISVELIEHKVGRKVSQLQFRVSKNIQTSIELPIPPIIDSTVVSRIRNLGVHASEAEDLFVSTDDNLLKKTLELTEGRLANKDLPPIDSPAGFFRAALRGKYALTAPPKSSAKSKPILLNNETELVTAPDPAREAAIAAFENIPIADQKRKLELFAETLAAPLRHKYVSEGLGSVLVRKQFEAWLAKDVI